MCPDSVHLRPGGKVKHQRSLATIEFLRKSEQRLGIPRLSIGRAHNAQLNCFLLHDGGDVQDDEKDPVDGSVECDRISISFSDYDSIRRDQLPVDHERTIVAGEFWYSRVN